VGRRAKEFLIFDLRFSIENCRRFKVEREARAVAAVIPINTAESNIIDATWAAAAGLKIPAALEANTSIGFKVCESQDGSFLPLYDETNALVQASVTLNAARAYALPDALFAWPYFKLWSQNAGVDVSQAAARTFTVLLKS
jgi:hypothetical protein